MTRATSGGLPAAPRLDAVRLVDLSVTLGPNPSEVVPIEIERIDHRAGGRHLAELVGLAPENLEGGLGWASERLSAITHAGTHMDAPWHYGPRVDGEPAITIDRVPLTWCLGPGVRLSVDPGAGAEEPIGIEELEAFEASHGAVAPGTLVLVHSGAQDHYGEPSYPAAGRPLEPALVEGLLDRGVRVIGTDAWSIDPSIEEMKRRAGVAGGRAVWRAHRVGRRRAFCIVEKLKRLDTLPATGFWIVTFPIKLDGGSAAWVRPVALVPDPTTRS